MKVASTAAAALAMIAMAGAIAAQEHVPSESEAAPNTFGWMIHANVFLGDDLGTIFGHEH